MNYIILDLEWDSAYYPKENRFINQILQIGAVKLDQSFDIVDTFEQNIRSSFSKKVSGRFARLTGITTPKMLVGLPFGEAVDRYNRWAGNDTVTMTWSDSDLYSIKENEESLLAGKKFAIGKYLDLQKFVQGEMRLNGYEDKNQISLSGAAELLDISTDDFELHTAKDDSLVCQRLLKKCYNKERFCALVRDTADPEFYKRLRFKPYAISDLNDKYVVKSALDFSCDVCGGQTRRITKWHYRNRWFTAKFECTACLRRFSGRVSFKKTYDDVKVRRKIYELKPKTENNNEMQPLPQKM